MSARHEPLSLRAQNADIVAPFFDDGIDVRMRLTGFSMKPLVRSCALLRFSARPAPRVGDIVLLRFPDGADGAVKLVAHRVVALDERQVWTKGDSSRAQDPPSPRESIVATALSIETKLGFSVPINNAPMRTVGLALSFVYPRLVRAYRTLWPRKDALSCAS